MAASLCALVAKYSLCSLSSNATQKCQKMCGMLRICDTSMDRYHQLRWRRHLPWNRCTTSDPLVFIDFRGSAHSGQIYRRHVPKRCWSCTTSARGQKFLVEMRTMRKGTDKSVFIVEVLKQNEKFQLSLICLRTTVSNRECKELIQTCLSADCWGTTISINQRFLLFQR